MKNRPLIILSLLFCFCIVIGSVPQKKTTIKDFQEMIKKQYAGYIGAATALAAASAVSPRFRSYLQKNVYFSLRKYPVGVALFGGVVGLDMYNKWNKYKNPLTKTPPIK